MEQIEDIINQACRSGVLQPVLEKLKVIDAIGPERDDFSIQQRRVYAELFGTGVESNEPLRPVLGFTGQVSGSAVFDAAQNAITVEFQFMNPLASRRYGLDQGCELGLDEIREPRAGVAFAFSHDAP